MWQRNIKLIFSSETVLNAIIDAIIDMKKERFIIYGERTIL